MAPYVRLRLLRCGAALATTGLLAVLAACTDATSVPSPASTPTTAATPSTSAPSSPPSTASPTRPSPRPTASRPVTSPSVRPTDPHGDPVARRVAADLESPWGLVALEDGSFLISERDTRRIIRVTDGDRTELATLDGVEPGGEGGLLGLALTPDSRTLLAYYTAAEDNRIVAMSWDGERLGDPEPILTGIPKGAIHNGGRMVVGPDDLLYVGTGEVGQEQLAQDTDNLGGKILRLTLDGEPAPGNPFDNEVWSYGHRNVQGLAFDDGGRLWASEYGSREFDELNLISAGDNYGWPLAEGPSDVDGTVNPKVVWPTDDASPSGLVFWQGDLWMAGLGGERLWQIPVDGTKAGQERDWFAGDYGRLRSLVVAPDQQSMYLTGSNTDGRGNVRGDDDLLLRITR